MRSKRRIKTTSIYTKDDNPTNFRAAFAFGFSLGNRQKNRINPRIRILRFFAESAFSDSSYISKGLYK